MESCNIETGQGLQNDAFVVVLVVYGTYAKVDSQVIEEVSSIKHPLFVNEAALKQSARVVGGQVHDGQG